MGCAVVTLERIGGDTQAFFERQGDRPVVGFSRVGGVSVRFGLVCGTNIGDGYLFASDGLLITIDGGKLKVRQI